MNAAVPERVWEGVYRSFAEAAGDHAVFDGETWLGKAVARAHNLRAQASATATVSPAAATDDYFLPVVAALAAKGGEPLRVLDFGGSLATSYLALEAMLPPARDFQFVIVETEAVCRKGRELFADRKNLTFRTDVPGPGERFSVVHCGSSLHYIDDWAALLGRLAALQPQYLVLSDLPAADNRTFVTAQQFHGRRIPVHFWNLGELIERVETLGFELALKARFVGYHASADMASLVAHFSPEDRLGYFSQLIFRHPPSREP